MAFLLTLNTCLSTGMYHFVQNNSQDVRTTPFPVSEYGFLPISGQCSFSISFYSGDTPSISFYLMYRKSKLAKIGFSNNKGVGKAVTFTDVLQNSSS